MNEQLVIRTALLTNIEALQELGAEPDVIEDVRVVLDAIDNKIIKARSAQQKKDKEKYKRIKDARH